MSVGFLIFFFILEMYLKLSSNIIFHVCGFLFFFILEMYLKLLSIIQYNTMAKIQFNFQINYVLGRIISL